MTPTYWDKVGNTLQRKKHQKHLKSIEVGENNQDRGVGSKNP